MNLYDKKVKEQIGFHYLLIEIQVYTLIFLGLNKLLNNYQTKSEINRLLTIYLEYKIINLLCADSILSLS